jgi:predicted SAM-dependent methyltransferase
MTSVPALPALRLTPHALPLSHADLVSLGLRGLHCGSGATLHPGLLNVDCMEFPTVNGGFTQPGHVYSLNDRVFYLQHDQTALYPIASRSVDWVFSEHFIEHITLEQAVAWLRELHRLLRPGGIVRISTPDLALYASGYGDLAQSFYRQHQQQLQRMGMREVPSRPAWMLNQIFRFYGHQWLYDLAELQIVAEAAGFDPQLVRRCSFRCGAVPQLAQLDQVIRSDESLYVELEASAA